MAWTDADKIKGRYVSKTAPKGGQHLRLDSATGHWVPGPSWHGVVYGALGDCNPETLLRQVMLNGTTAATPSNIATNRARLSYFRPPADITVSNVRYYGVGNTSSVYRFAIYNADTLARVTPETAFSTSSEAWGAASLSPSVTLSADQLYFIATSVNATGTTAGPACFMPTVGVTTGLINVVPKSWPGSLGLDQGHVSMGLAKFATGAGALPDPSPSIDPQVAETGGFPAYWLDSA